MLRIIYTIAFYLLLPFIGLRLLWRSKKNIGYRQRTLERFGIFTYTKTTPSLWVHAVSLGEVIAATPLIEALLKKYPEKTIAVTTMTPTGSARVQAAFGDRVFHVYLPYDIPFAISRFLKHVQPQILIIMETELWPNLLTICDRKNIPVMIANARLSARSSKGYKKIRFFMQLILKHVRLVAAQTKMDRERYIQIGLQAERARIAGNIKFDRTLDPTLLEKAHTLRASWDEQRPVLIAASTHAGEDEPVLDAFSKIRTIIPNLLLILVPRHPERFNEVTALTQKKGYLIGRRSQPETVSSKIDVLIGDTMGELMLMYAASDVAFVGGSFANVGGHNLLEPAALAIPTLTGPNMFNFTEINAMLQSRGAVAEVKSANDLAEKTLHWLLNKDAAKQAGSEGKAVVLENQGALQRHLEWIQELLP